jgi:hypothetical protein
MGTDHVTGKLAPGADPRRVKSEPSGRADLGQHKQLERGGSDQAPGITIAKGPSISYPAEPLPFTSGKRLSAVPSATYRPKKIASRENRPLAGDFVQSP